MQSIVKRMVPESLKRLRRRIFYKGNVNPSLEFIEIVKSIIENKNDESIRIAEIGVDRGATTYELVKLLRQGDSIDLFDIESCPLFKNIHKIENLTECEIRVFANSTKLYDSYSWNLCKIFLERYADEHQSTEIWDAVYLDGAHRFNIDAPATCLVKSLLRNGGFIVFDDMDWTMAHSPTSNTRKNWARYTSEQMNEPHVRLIVDAFMRTDDNFEELTSPKETRAIFRKIR